VQASVIALLAWKLAVEAVKRLRQAGFEIDIGRPYFDIVCEFLVFLAVAADRVAYGKLDATARADFTTALVKRLAEMIDENRYLLLGDVPPAGFLQHFLALYNRRSADYAEFDYGADGPDFRFRRYFAAGLREALPPGDQLWVVDQAMDIEAPEALVSLHKALAGLFDPESAESRRRRNGAGTTGE
jgi:hypothetical protein